MDYRMFSIVLTLLLWISISPLPTVAAETLNKALVMIDPAHGGKDAGVVTDRLREKDITLQLALLIWQEAQKGRPFEVQLLRQSDRTMTVDDRVKVVDAAKPACLVSLHVNAGFGKKAEGYEVYFPGFRQDPAAKDDAGTILEDMTANRRLNDSVRLAQQIQASLETVFPRKGRGLRDAPNALLERVNVPGLVVEVGFATQPEEREKLSNPATQKVLALAILRGLRSYLQQKP